ALEISVAMAQYPSPEIAWRSDAYRTLGLGHSNIGGFLMSSGIPYDSAEGRALCGAITALMTGTAYAPSAEMARKRRPFSGYAMKAGPVLRVMRNHRRAAQGISEGYEGLRTAPPPLDHRACLDRRLLARAVHAFDKAIELGTRHGYRNAQ